jgi:hypothetical protein
MKLHATRPGRGGGQPVPARPRSRCLPCARASQAGDDQTGVSADLVLGEADVAPAFGRVELGLLPEAGRGWVARLARHEQGTSARTAVGALDLPQGDVEPEDGSGAQKQPSTRSNRVPSWP